MRRTNKGLLQASAGRHAARVQSTGKFPFVFSPLDKDIYFSEIPEVVAWQRKAEAQAVETYFSLPFWL